MSEDKSSVNMSNDFNEESMATPESISEERGMVTSLLGSQERTAVDVIVDRLLDERESVIEIRGEVDKAYTYLDQAQREVDNLRNEARRAYQGQRDRRAKLMDSNLVSYAKHELRLAGFYDRDMDYGPGEIARAVMELVETFSLQDHSGMSASLVTEVIHKLFNFEQLTPLTSDPEEWTNVSEQSGVEMWQSKRNPSVFSNDGGDTWYTIEASQASFGDRVSDGGEMGTIVRCQECGGSGQLHKLDTEPRETDPDDVDWEDDDE